MRKIIVVAVIACIVVAGWMAVNHRAQLIAGQNPGAGVTGQPGDIGPGSPNRSAGSQQSPGQARTATPSGSRSASAEPTGTDSASPVGKSHVPGSKPHPGASSAVQLPYSEQLTDQQLHTAFDESLVGQTRPAAQIETQATAVVWKHLAPDIAAAHLWTHIRLRDAAAVCEGSHPDPNDPVLLTVITLWSGTATDHRTEVHRDETRVARSGDTWNVLPDH